MRDGVLGIVFQDVLQVLFGGCQIAGGDSAETKQAASAQVARVEAENFLQIANGRLGATGKKVCIGLVQQSFDFPFLVE